MDLKPVRNVIIVVFVVILGITLANFVLASVLGVNVSDLPAGAKAVVHIAGLLVVIVVIKKIFVR